MNINSETLLPPHLVPIEPEYYVWYTGTLGQAEWLIAYSDVLRGKALPAKITLENIKNFAEVGEKGDFEDDVEIHEEIHEIAQNLIELPEKIRPLLALEHPDLIVTNKEGDPLFSIEITEQQDFGSNGQQRIARLWSALLNKVPSAYLLPIESYQLEKVKKDEDLKAFNAKNSSDRDLQLAAAQIPSLTYSRVKKNKITTPEELLEAIESESLDLTVKQKKDVDNYYKRHIRKNIDIIHLKNVDFREYIHEVDKELQRIYIRRPLIPGSMLLNWIEIASKSVPTAVFKLQSQYELLFRTNGLPHTMRENRFPFLSYRNLPLGPGVGEIVHKEAGKDEIALFFEMLDVVLLGKNCDLSSRKKFTEDDAYFPKEIKNTWRDKISKAKILIEKGSGDYEVSPSTLIDSINRIGHKLTDYEKTNLGKYSKCNVYKISSSSKTRSLGDPYSGCLAVRDLLFARGGKCDFRDAQLFNRDEALIFWVKLDSAAATHHKFIHNEIESAYQKYIATNTTKSPQQKLIEIIENVRAERLNKNFRCHIIFSDIIIVERSFKNKTNYEIIFGLPYLSKMKLLDETTSELVKSLKI